MWNGGGGTKKVNGWGRQAQGDATLHCYCSQVSVCVAGLLSTGAGPHAHYIHTSAGRAGQGGGSSPLPHRRDPPQPVRERPPAGTATHAGASPPPPQAIPSGTPTPLQPCHSTNASPRTATARGKDGVKWARRPPTPPPPPPRVPPWCRTPPHAAAPPPPPPHSCHSAQDDTPSRVANGGGQRPGGRGTGCQAQRRWSGGGGGRRGGGEEKPPAPTEKQTTGAGAPARGTAPPRSPWRAPSPAGLFHWAPRGNAAVQRGGNGRLGEGAGGRGMWGNTQPAQEERRTLCWWGGECASRRASHGWGGGGRGGGPRRESNGLCTAAAVGMRSGQRGAGCVRTGDAAGKEASGGAAVGGRHDGRGPTAVGEGVGGGRYGRRRKGRGRAPRRSADSQVYLRCQT